MRAAPERPEAWSHAEELADALQRPDDLAAAYREVLDGQLARPVRHEVARRAVKFHDEWFGDNTDAMAQLLDRIIELDPEASWAFERLVVVLTVAERWDALLDVYDRALSLADPVRRRQLLDDAGHLAKDFANDPGRAVDYMMQQLELEPGDANLIASIERLLERQHRYEDLIELWQARVPELPNLEARHTRIRIATTFIDHLDAPGPALEELRALVDEAPGHAEGCVQLERILAMDAAPHQVRMGALALLRTSYESVDDDAKVITAIERALGFAEPGERIGLHRDAGARLAIAGRGPEAIAHYATLLKLEPTDADARKQLRQLAGPAGLHADFAAALVDAAVNAEPAQRMALRFEAAQIYAQALDRPEQAVELLGAVVDDGDADRALALSAAHQLGELLARAGRNLERLGVLERLADLEHSSSLRRQVLGEAGRLADALSDPDRALSAYARRLADDPRDRDALDATIGVLERAGRHADLAATLSQRADATELAQQRRADLVRRARLLANELSSPAEAIDAWLAIRREFGDEHDTVDALDDLLAGASRSDERATVAAAAATSLRDRTCRLLVRLGDVRRTALAQHEPAAAAYADALAIDPADAGAKAGLRALLDDPAAARPAANALASALRRTGDGAGLLELVDVRVRLCDDPRAAIVVLREAAALQEQQAGEPVAALEAIAHAFTLDPTDTGLEHEMLRLGASAGRWDLVADAYHTATAVAAHAARAAHLHLGEGRIRERELGDAAGATRAYAAAAAHDPESIEVQRALVRAGAAAGDWKASTRGAIAICHAREGVDDEALTALEIAADATDSWPALVAAFERELADATRLPAAIARDLELASARWQRDRVGDPAAAREAAARAVARTPDHAQSLELLAQLQRTTEDAGLVATLLRLDGLQADDTVWLREAAEHVVAAEPDSPRARTLAAQLYRKAARLLELEGTQASALRRETTTWALGHWVDAALAAGDRRGAVDALLQAAELPLPREQVLELRLRAARLCIDLDERARAIDLMREVLEERRDDRELIAELAALCEREQRILELVHLRTRELDLTADRDRRLALRLELSRLVGELERRGGRVESLERNLAERAGHPASVDALSEILADKGRHGQLCEILEQQAAVLEGTTEGDRAAELWAMAAKIAEERLADNDRAIAALSRQVELVPAHEALDALARLHVAKNEPAAAAACLQRRLATTEAGNRVPVLLRLGRAQLQADREAEAIATLEAAFAEAPKNTEVRKLLLRLYRAREQWEQLAHALAIAAEAVGDPPTVIAYAREAAEIYGDRLGTPDKAVQVLERALALGEPDRELRARLGEGLRVAGRTAEAKALLEDLVAAYGRRRSPERAAVHLQLGRVLHAQGDRAAAIDQLELAAGMDAANPAIMLTLAQTAREDGQLDRAERAYRALLMLVRRPAGEADAVRSPFGAAQTLVELASIAAERKQDARAQELLESALEALRNNDDEAPALQQRLRDRGEHELLQRVLEARLQHVDNRRRRAEVLAELAGLYEHHLGDTAKALDLALQAIGADPGSPPLHDRARALAEAQGELARYADELEGLLDKARRTSDVHVRCELLLRLGEVMEKDKGDWDRAADLYAQAEGTGVREVDVWRASARVAAARGDNAEHLRILERLAAMGEQAAETRADALYRMAEVQLADPETTTVGIATLHEALATDAKPERAARILVRATDPEQAAPRADLLGLFEQVARKSGDEATVLLALERKVALPDVDPDQVREAVELAQRRGQGDRAEVMMLRAVELGNAMLDGAARISWALVGLAEHRLGADDNDGAVKWFVEAAAVCPPADLLALAQRIAEAVGDDRERVRLYEALLERDPALRGAWEPLAEIHRKTGDTARLHRLVDETLDSLDGTAERNAMRLQLVHALLELGDPRGEAVDVLREVLREDPDHEEGQRMLLEVLERSGRGDEVVELLRSQLLADQERNDGPAVARASLSLARRVVGNDREDALSLVRTGLQFAPTDRDLLYAVCEWLDPEEQFDERADAIERLVELEPADVAVGLATELADGYAARGDQDSELRTLVLGYRRQPQQEAIRLRLERAYEGRGDYRGMAEMLRTASEHEQDPALRNAILRQAATIHRELLGDPEAAVAILERARALAPDDVSLGLELVSALASAGRHEHTLALLGELIAAADGDELRLQLLTTRAELRLQGNDLVAAIEDLEAATALYPAGSAATLTIALERRREELQASGGGEPERAVTLRLVEVLLMQDRRDEARDLLLEWVDRERKDAAALTLLQELDTIDERWDAVAKTSARLVAIESAEAQVQAALRLSYACQQMGKPEDARAGLEHARRKQPGSREVRDELVRIYELVGADRELAKLLAAQAEETEDNDERAELMRRAAELFIAQGDTETALPLVRSVLEAHPEDPRATVTLADAYLALGEVLEAQALLDGALADGSKRKPPELALLHHRRSRAAGARGAHDEQLNDLQVAFGHDKNNGQVAAELADLAEALEQWELAVRVLRTITLIDGDCPISRTSAFLRQAKIAYRRGDRQRAVLWARKAKHEGPDSPEVAEFMAELGES
ncbi:MAG TPA: tetratricopeptide repeat protein [Nannocystaceae bacterium]|nr:tetratricopeptide repeat protein [Nannocystaceae bacterium]